ncbi:MAG: DUF2975 domain-containing protein [Sphingobacteriales bacterium]|nr:DUF2975 domain-containing protein [Sphingobacteriales bacterium]
MEKRKFSRLALITTAIPVAYFLYIFISIRLAKHSGFPGNGFSYSLPVNDTTFRNAFFFYDIDDSLPHYQYRKTEDSLKVIQHEIDQQNKGYFINSAFWGFIGFSKLRNPIKLDERKKTKEQQIKVRIDSIKQAAQSVKDPDSIAQLVSLEKEIFENGIFSKNDEIYGNIAPGDFDYFITLKGYKLPEDDKFFVQNGNYYIAHLVTGNSEKKEPGERAAHFIRKQAKVRYHETYNTISIPVSKRWYTILNSISFIVVILFWITFAYVIIGLPASILVSISRGRAFTEQNIRDMKIIYRFLLGYGVLRTIYPYLEEWGFSEYISGNFISTSGLNSFFSSLPLFLSGLAVLLVCKAFQKGYKMQQEQDLTV